MAKGKHISVQDISFSYGEQKALEGVHVKLNAGKFTGIVGPNGCGKSTFLDLLIAKKKPDSGQILLNGKGLDQYRRKELAREMALVPQKFFINFPFTVKEVLLMGRHPYIARFSAPTKKDWGIIEEIADNLGISDLLHRFITELSGGEIQRVVMARALVQDTPVLLLDEATSNMDIRYTLDILNELRRKVIEKGYTVVAVMHDLNLAAMYCDEIVLMQGGKIFSKGMVEEILTAENIKEVFEVDATVCSNGQNGSRSVFYHTTFVPR